MLNRTEEEGKGKKWRGPDILSQVINPHHFQIKGLPLHQGQLLHNSLLANHLSNGLLLNLSLGMPNKAQAHIYPLLFLMGLDIDFPLFLWILTERD